MTVYEEVRAKRNSEPVLGYEGRSKLPDYLWCIRLHEKSARDGQSIRDNYVSIAALAIAAIEALDAEKGKEAGNVE